MERVPVSARDLAPSEDFGAARAVPLCTELGYDAPLAPLKHLDRAPRSWHPAALLLVVRPDPMFDRAFDGQCGSEAGSGSGVDSGADSGADCPSRVLGWALGPVWAQSLDCCAVC